MDRCQHLDLAALELLPGFDVAVGGVADHPRRPPRDWLLVEERAGVVAVVLVCGRERDRGQDRRVGRRRGVDLLAGEGTGRDLAAVAHLGV